jgi:N utilization substance protein B
MGPIQSTARAATQEARFSGACTCYNGGMTRRSRAREVALQLLFQRDHNPGVDRPAIEAFAAQRLRDADVRRFCLELFDGVVSHLDDIDLKLAAAAENWRLARMATVDRNLLRLGAFEILFQKETPPAVALDEAIELARRFGSADSSAFVNGVLDRLRREAQPGETEPPPPHPAPAKADQGEGSEPVQEGI